MTVRDVQVRNLTDRLDESRNCVFIVDEPDTVTDTVFRHEVVERLRLFLLLDDHGCIFIASVAQEDRSGVRVASVDVSDTVAFLFFTSKLVLLDHTRIVFVHRRRTDESRLRPAVHRQFIYIERR